MTYKLDGVEEREREGEREEGWGGSVGDTELRNSVRRYLIFDAKLTE